VKDADGKVLEVGDRVAMYNPMTIAELAITEVTGFTPRYINTKDGLVNPSRLVKLWSQEKGEPNES